jgi:hypothetical protein
LVWLPLAFAAENAPTDSKSPSFARDANRPAPSQTAVESTGKTDQADSSVLNTFPPSFYGGSAQPTTSSIGTPDFAAPAPQVASPSPANYPFQWGPFAAHPHLGYSFIYASGVLVAPGQQTTTAQHLVSPGLAIISKHLLLDYTPSLGFYSKGPYDDTVNHSASLAANFGYKDWSFHIAQGYEKATNPLIETGAQTETETLVTSVDATWDFNQKFFFDFTLYQQFLNAQGFQNSRQWSSMEWANYRLTPRLSVGAGLGGGYSDVDFGSDSTFEQIQGRVNWHPSSRLVLNLNGGIEIRQFVSTPGSDNLINPIMGASATYLLFEPTSLYIAANRSVGSSFFANEVTETASISGGVSQRFLKYMHVGVSAGYRSSDYISTAANQSFESTRQDSYSFVSTTLGTSFLGKGSATLAYTHSNNQSTVHGYTYDSDQFALHLIYRF